MNILKRLCIWTLIALILQHGIFLYLENVYMAADLNIEFIKDDDDNIEEIEKSEVNIKKGAENISASSNGQFVAYMENNNLNILDSSNDKVNTAKSNGEIMLYKWVTNSNRIIAVQKIKEKGKYYFEPIAFDGSNGDFIELADFHLNKLRISVESDEDIIEDIAFSTATHSFYIKVKRSNGLCDLYQGNTMNELKRVRENKNIGNVVVPTTGAKPFMEMGNNVTRLDSPDNLKVSNFKNPKVLGADINDNIYFGEEEDGKITRICYADASGDYSKWNEIKIINSADRDDIIVDYSGKLYINNANSNSILEVKSNKKINYEGEFLQIYDKGIISKDNNKLIKNVLK